MYGLKFHLLTLNNASGFPLLSIVDDKWMNFDLWSTDIHTVNWCRELQFTLRMNSTLRNPYIDTYHHSLMFSAFQESFCDDVLEFSTKVFLPDLPYLFFTLLLLAISNFSLNVLDNPWT